MPAYAEATARRKEVKMLKVKKLSGLISGLGLLFGQVGLALAQSPAPGNRTIEIKNPDNLFQIQQVGTLISGVVGLAMIISALLAFVYLVWGGLEWIGSGGDKAGMESARGRITNAFIGLFIVAAAWAITKLIEGFFGVTIISGGITIPKAY